MQAQSCEVKLYPILLGEMSFGKLPPGLRYGLSTTNCVPFPDTAERKDGSQMAMVLQSMKQGGSALETGTPVQNAEHELAPAAVTNTTTTAASHRLALIPKMCPSLPVCLNSRSLMFQQVVTALTAPAGAHSNKTHSVYGMGGIGKTTLVSNLVRDESIRQHFARMCFIPVGNDPEVLTLQRMLYLQLTDTPLLQSGTETVGSQLQQLQQACNTAENAGQRILIVLDDVWSPELYDQLDCVEDDASHRVLVTSRLTKVTGTSQCTEHRVGLLPEADAASLLLATARVEQTNARIELARSIADMCGA
jgi:hypothetical protein